MLQVFLPDSCIPELRYCIECLLFDFLPLRNQLVQHVSSDDQVCFSGSAGTLYLESDFFTAFENDGMLSERFIPTVIKRNTIGLLERKFPVVSLYGEDRLTSEGNDFTLHADILGSTFFMLTRWEETVSTEKDQHGRFPDRASLAVKHNFYQRPIVNEYVELLWALLKKIHPELQRKPRSYQATLTCDVDELQRWKGLKDVAFWSWYNGKQGQWNALKKDWGSILKKLQGLPDPYFNLEWMVEQANKQGISTHFYLKALRSHPKYDQNKYDLNTYRSLWSKLQKLEAGVGMHPSYNSHEDKVLMEKELRSFTDAKLGPTKVRQHFLRFQNPKTWQIQNQLGFTEDSTMGFSDRAGFRCGVCYPFPVFDIENRKKLDLYENPLLLMETPYLSQNKHQELLEDAETIAKAVKKYGGNNVVLWHNSNLHYREHKKLFSDFLKIIA